MGVVGGEATCRTGKLAENEEVRPTGYVLRIAFNKAEKQATQNTQQKKKKKTTKTSKQKIYSNKYYDTTKKTIF